jgi:hypothetical protein
MPRLRSPDLVGLAHVVPDVSGDVHPIFDLHFSLQEIAFLLHGAEAEGRKAA